jgi:hypothetical protein
MVSTQDGIALDAWMRECVDEAVDSRMSKSFDHLIIFAFICSSISCVGWLSG